MKQEIHTIPVVEAFEAGDECPFCYVERQIEQRVIRYFAGPGASYMEPEVRGITNRTGFCGAHTKKLYDYGNALGNALMIQTHYAEILQELQAQAENYEIPPKKGLFKKKKPADKKPYWLHLRERVECCAICDRVEDNIERQYRVFFDLLKEDEFRDMILHSKGFCLRHFSRLLEAAEQHLPDNRAQWFYSTVYSVMSDNLVRVKEDLDWLIAKYDYRHAGADWKNSRDALPRAMQKMVGIHPADPPYRKD